MHTLVPWWGGIQVGTCSGKGMSFSPLSTAGLGSPGPRCCAVAVLVPDPPQSWDARPWLFGSLGYFGSPDWLVRSPDSATQSRVIFQDLLSSSSRPASPSCSSARPGAARGVIDWGEIKPSSCASQSCSLGLPGVGRQCSGLLSQQEA